MTTAAMRPPKHIKVDGQDIRFPHVQTLAWIIITAAAGAYIITALYYLIVEVHWWLGGHSLFDLKPGWDALINRPWWSDGRHDYRNCYEGALATLLAKSIITKRKYWTSRVSDLQVALRVIAVVAVTFAIITAGIYVVDIQTRVHIASAVHNYQAYLIGFIAAQACHQIWAPAGNTIQLFFLESSVARAQASGHWPWWVKHPVAPPRIRQRFSWMMLTQRPVATHGRPFAAAAWALAGLGVLLALYGTFVHFVVAPGHVPPGALF